MLKNKHYYNALDRQRYEKIQERLASDQLKQMDLIEIKNREKNLEKVKEMEKEQKHKYLEYMNNNYKTTLDYKRELQKEKRESELEEERLRLKIIDKDLKDEQFRKQKKKETYIQEIQQVENHKKIMNEMEKQKVLSKLE